MSPKPANGNLADVIDKIFDDSAAGTRIILTGDLSWEFPVGQKNIVFEIDLKTDALNSAKRQNEEEFNAWLEGDSYEYESAHAAAMYHVEYELANTINDLNKRAHEKAGMDCSLWCADEAEYGADMAHDIVIYGQHFVKTWHDLLNEIDRYAAEDAANWKEQNT